MIVKNYSLKDNVEKNNFFLFHGQNVGLKNQIIKNLFKIKYSDNIFTYLAQAGLVVLTLNIVMMVFAYYLAKTFASGIKQIKCISLECGLQNGTLAVFIATEISNEIVYMIPTAAYALIMYITGFIFIYFLRNKA